MCEMDTNYDTSSCPILGKCLFGARTLAKNADIDKYKYSGYGTEFDRHRFLRL